MPDLHTDTLPETAVLALAYKIRDIINEPRRRRVLEGDLPRLYQLVACLDVIEDAEYAIDAHTKHDRDDFGSLYLATYGLLQALIIQQDAVGLLMTCLERKYDPHTDRRLKEIRDVRVRAAGHPSRTRPRSDRSAEYHSIARVSLSTEGFSMMSATGPNNSMEEISLARLKEEQQQAIGDALEALLAQLEREEEDHRALFRDERLAGYLAGVPGAWATVRATVAGDDSGPPIAIPAQEIRSAVTSFVAAMNRRGLPLYAMEDGGKRLYAALDRIVNARRRPDDVAFVDRSLAELSQVAAEWDDDYSGL